MKKLILAVALALAVLGGVVAVSTVGSGVVTVTAGGERVSEVEPNFMRWQPHLATGWLLRL